MLPDWQRSLKKWREENPGLSDEELKQIKGKKVLRFHNDHTNGYSVRFFWDKTLSNAKNQSSYVFKATRTAKETLATFIKKFNILEYFE